MNYIRHLTGFFERAAKDYHLNPTHISLYMSIFQLWNLNRFKNPISLSRSELMGLSKVSSKTTYHKCMKELQQFGYLRYDPSYHPLRGSWVHLFNFNGIEGSSQSKNCPGTGLALDKQWIGTGQAMYKLGSETQAGKEFQGPLNIYKHIKHNKLSLGQPAETFEKMKRERNENNKEKNNMPAAAENKSIESSSIQAICSEIDTDETARKPAENSLERIPENETQVIRFFLESGYEEVQAIKFYLYYAATGWKFGGKTPIENWRAAAHGWILNAQNTSKNGKSSKSGISAGRLHTQSDKNYSEPL